MWQSSRPASFSSAGLTLWPSWLERWLATLSGLSVQVRISVGLSVPGHYNCMDADTRFLQTFNVIQIRLKVHFAFINIIYIILNLSQQFCTWHNNFTVVAAAKMFSNTTTMNKYPSKLNNDGKIAMKRALKRDFSRPKPNNGNNDNDRTSTFYELHS